MENRIVLAGAIAISFLSGCISYQPTGFSSNESEDPKNEVIAQEHEETALVFGRVTYVIDGDTFIVSLDGNEVKVRLIGVDTPESCNQSHPELNCEEGKITAEYTNNLLLDQAVWLESDIESTDKYDRLLAYVYLDEEMETMVQKLLLENGLATCMPVPPNLKYQNDFARIQEEARNDSVGFWAVDFWN